MQRRMIGLLLGLLCQSGIAFGEDEAQLWTETGVRLKATKAFAVTLTENIRLRDNFATFDSVKSDLEAEWRAHKHFRLGIGYRLSFETNKNGRFEGAHRVHLQAVARNKTGPLRLSYRVRFQEGIKREDQETRLRHVLRNRFKVGVDTDTIAEPDIAVEVFNRFADEAPVQLQTLRTTLGLGIRPNKHHRVRTYYRLEIPLFDTTDPRLHIIGVGYQYRFKID